jgi:hypothetical protein
MLVTILYEQGCNDLEPPSLGRKMAMAPSLVCNTRRLEHLRK